VHPASIRGLDFQENARVPVNPLQGYLPIRPVNRVPSLGFHHTLHSDQIDKTREMLKVSRMNLTLSVPDEIAAKAKAVAAQQGKSLSAWFRQQVDRGAEEFAVRQITGIDPEIGAMLGAALPLEEHWDDPRWRGLAEKHLR